jgi:oxaloacetate decarboxylase alpha subunit
MEKMKPLKITETSLRDGHQSLIATRMTTDEMIPILEKMDQVGYHAIEVWGGATFDSCLRFLNEDPWERLRTIRKHVKNTKLQMLLRGQNLVGYRHYADDTVEEFIKKAIKNGIDIVRVFDALNDSRNMKKSIDVIKSEGAHCQCAISYATSKVHNTDYFVNLIKELELMGADSICIKDMSGILKPYDAYHFIKEIKKVSDLPIELHNHCTGGVASMTLIKAVEAGVDIVDTAISPFSSGTSQPPTETIVEAFRDTEHETGLDILILDQIADHFKVIRDKYLADGTLSPKVLFVEPRTLLYQVPGGMLSNLVSQLKSLNAEGKFEEVLREIPKVREDLGFPPLVTPLSQMVGTQAVFNVITASRYKMVPNEIKSYVKGLYGKPPGPISDDIRKLIIGDGEVITVRPADLLENELEIAKAEILDLYESMEDVLSYVLFPQIAKEFLENRKFNSYDKAEGYIG